MADNEQNDEAAAPSKWAFLLTEQRNPRSEQIDELATLDMLRVMNAEDRRVPAAVGEVLPNIAEAVDRVVDAFGLVREQRYRLGGLCLYLFLRLIIVGCGLRLLLLILLLLIRLSGFARG